MLSEREQIFLDRAYDKYSRPLFQYSLSLLRTLPDSLSLAEECMQETFEVALRKIKVLQRHEALEGWLVATCKHITISKRRKILKRMSFMGNPIPIDDAYNVADINNRIEEWIEQNDHQQKKRLLIQALTEQELAVFHLYYEKELSLKDSAEQLEMSENAVQGSIQKIRAKARKLSMTFLIPLWFVLLF